MSSKAVWSTLFRGAAVALALLTLGTYVFITSCTRAAQRDSERPQAVTSAPAQATPPTAPIYLPETKAAPIAVMPPRQGVTPPPDNAAAPPHANEPGLPPPLYLSATKSGIVHIVPTKPTAQQAQAVSHKAPPTPPTPAQAVVQQTP